MKIALLGYGKMGKAIEKIAVERGHSIVLKISDDIDKHNIQTADVAIDFSIPEAAVKNISNCIKNGVPVISGTTGWLKNYSDMVALANKKDGAFIYASNFSLGVNIFFELNKLLAKMMANLSQYKVDLEEIHHTQKLDAPSGTAITLAEGIIENTHYSDWSLGQEKSKTTIPIESKRIDAVPGTHFVNYTSNVDTISMSHTAHNREGFALGAVIASEWIIGKTGVFTMNDVLNIG
ncbi:4-hydroxy-tetrahydrodipicolinate reductase [Pontimicrobium aquaticum]|uniref:4-hydroxy-tetrahydrodipicolinate reductase n=1 Tax=Pontimicrobium aquaticum TaxID=2565367 RepID=A0A4U0EWB5_9FLAO|nr:4-hydroxy-tetrahydrodipicolinate reductase [Pontimicrobium aquaticum]TJY36261.1 4-hydroxy-tetrahydrodipicolinate reductase [Pontimicrobium aquaticum]